MKTNMKTLVIDLVSYDMHVDLHIGFCTNCGHEPKNITLYAEKMHCEKCNTENVCGIARGSELGFVEIDDVNYM